jgi:hypothetical protein
MDCVMNVPSLLSPAMPLCLSYNRYLETAFAKMHFLITWAHTLTRKSIKAWCPSFISHVFTLSCHFAVTLESRKDRTDGYTSCDKNGNYLPAPSDFLIMTRPYLINSEKMLTWIRPTFDH